MGWPATSELKRCVETVVCSARPGDSSAPLLSTPRHVHMYVCTFDQNMCHSFISGVRIRFQVSVKAHR